MKKLILFFTLFIGSCGLLMAQETLIEGIYQGKDLYIQNPMTSNYSEFCVQEVYVNDQKVAEKLRTSAFVVRLSHLSIGDPVRIKLLHRENCSPKVLNPQVIRAKLEAFQFRAIEISEDSLRWLTAGEHAAGLFVVEKYIENHWEPLESLEVPQEKKARVFSVPVRHEKGQNKYRVRLVEKGGKVYYSTEKDYQN